jgi:hypothetical protein
VRFLEALAAAAVVAIVVAVIASRAHADIVLVPAAAFLATFLAVMLRTRTAGRIPIYRRRRR